MTFRRMVLLVALPLVLPAGMARAGDTGSKAGQAAQVATVAPGIVDGATAHRLAASGVKVVDVRTPEEFETGHVPGAINIPHDQMDRRYGEIGPPSTPVLLYCRSGRRTAIAAATLREKGFNAIYDLQAYDRWVESEPKR